MTTNRRVFPSLRVLLVLAAMATLWSLLEAPRAKAGPDPCPPADADTFFFDCFDLGDTNGADDSDSQDVVDSDNEDAWTEAESGGACRIGAEELLLISTTIPSLCNSITSPVVTISGFSAVSVSFEWGGSARFPDQANTIDVLLSEDGGAFEPVETLTLSVNSCDTGGGNCADTTFATTAEFDDCGEHTLQLRFTGPTGDETNFAVDDVRIVGTECVEEDTEGPFGDPTCEDGLDNDDDSLIDADDPDCAEEPDDEEPDDDDDRDGDGAVLPPIDINNNNLNLNNNQNNNNLINDNINTNTNTNENNQEQENEQDQNNTNDQVVNVDSSPSVNINWD